jgi:PAS domain S-box-containing protein
MKNKELGKEKLRNTGIELIGNVPWGTHFCQFYQTREDLISILVPYFQAGLENNEYCMWVTSEPLNVEDARKALKKEVRDLDDYIKKGQIEILDYSQWYTKPGHFVPDDVLQSWIEKERQARKRGFAGLRLTGNTFWLEKRDWKKFTDYEAAVNDIIGKHHMLAICTYSLDKCTGLDIADVIVNHQFALIKRGGEWEIIESSERKRTEEAIQESESKYRSLIENLKDIVFTIDLDGKITFASPSIEEILGYKSEEVINKNIIDFVPVKDRQRAIETIPKGMKGERITQYQTQAITKSGEMVILEVTFSRIWGKGVAVGALAIARDITERKRAEEALKKSEEKLSSTLSSMNDLIFNIDQHGVFIDYFQPEDHPDLYIHPEVFIGRPFIETLPPHVSKLLETAIAEVVATGMAQTFDYPMEIAGSEMWFTAKVSMREGASGEYAGVTGIVRNITERRRAEEKVKKSEQKFRTIFESIPGGILIVDQDLRVQAINNVLEQTFGICRTEVVNKRSGEALRCIHAFEYENPQDYGFADYCQSCQVRNTALEALAGKQVHQSKAKVELLVEGKVEERSLLISAAPIEYEGKKQAIVILEDITELSQLRQRLKTEQSFAGIISRDVRVLELFETIKELAEVNAPVLIQGESGSGKELVASAIHNEGPRADKQFIPVNCGALPDGLLESELFGHVRGAFTGAIRDKKGRFELADGGTIFLDEVGDLSPAMQVKLLRVLQTGCFEQVGGEKTIKVNVRVISATNKSLEKEIAAGRFREDLYYRLCVVPITMPPLRERVSDIPPLTEHFLERAVNESGRENVSLSSEALAMLMDYEWPGNVRELQNALQFALVKSRGQIIEPQHLPFTIRQEDKIKPGRRRRRRKLESKAVVDALRQTKGNKLKAAKLLGVSRITLYRFLAEEKNQTPDS